MKWIVRGILAVIVLVVLIIGAAFVFLATFNPNDYKDQITATAKSAIGRDVTISGDIEATFFPVLGFKALGVEMGNPDGFAQKDFLKVGLVQAGVKIMPLINHKIELTQITLKEPSIHIIKKANGETNLTFATPNTPTQKSTVSSSGVTTDFRVDAIEVTGASVIYDDLATGKTTTIDPLNVTLPGFVPGKETNVSIDMVMNSAGSSIGVKGSAKVKAAPEDAVASVSDLKADITMASDAMKDKVQMSLTGKGVVNSKTQEMDISVPQFNLSWAGTDISGNTAIKGKFTAPAIQFALTSPSVNLDKLMAGLNKKPDAGATSSAPSSATQADLLPVDMIRTLDLNGDIAIKEFIFNGLAMNNVQAKINAKNGDVNIAPLTADLYQGKTNARVDIDVRSSTPVIRFKNDVTGVEVGDVLKAKIGDDYVNGKATVNIDVTAQGNNVKALQNTAGGTVDFNFAEGSVSKWELSRLINQAIAFYETHKLTMDAPDKLYFTDLKGTFTGQNGVFRNDNLRMAAPKFHALGNGVVNIAAGTVDYNVQVGSGEPDPTAKHIPIRITGPLSAPHYALDTKSLVVDTVKDKIKDKLLEKLGGGVTAPAAQGEAAPTSNKPEDMGKQLLRGLLSQ